MTAQGDPFSTVPHRPGSPSCHSATSGGQHRNRRLMVGAMHSLEGTRWYPRAVIKPISGALKKLPEWATNALKAWFRFFWRLGAIGKITVTVGEIIALSWLLRASISRKRHATVLFK